MNDYNVSDYGIFSNAISTVKTLNTQVDSMKSSVTDCKGKLNDSVFMGPAADSCTQALGTSDSKLSLMSSNFTTIADYLVETSTTYQSGDSQASQKILNINGGNVGTSTVSATALTGSDNQEKIYNYLLSQGLNKAAACGIMANIKQESNFKTGDYGDNGTSYGICQWHNTRFTELQNYCSSNNLDYTSLEGQLSFLSYELQNKYPELLQTLKSVPDTQDGAYQAAYAMTVKYERPANMEWRGEQRGYSAQEMLSNYASQR